MGGKGSHVPNPTRKALADLQREGYTLQQILEFNETAGQSYDSPSDGKQEPEPREPDPDIAL